MKEETIKTLKNFSTSITHIDGTRYYIMTYHFYIKYFKENFSKTYDINPIKEFLSLEKYLPLMESDPVAKKKYEDKLEKQLEICTNLNFNDYIYVPFCAVLISKYPYLKQMEKSLETIVNMMTHTIDENLKTKDTNIKKDIYNSAHLNQIVENTYINNNRNIDSNNKKGSISIVKQEEGLNKITFKFSKKDILNFIVHLCKEIPVPNFKSVEIKDNANSLYFMLPDRKFAYYLSLQNPKLQKLPLIDNCLIELLNMFSLENLITIHHLMLLEQKILFVHDDFQILPKVIDAFTTLLYPLEWIHTYIPILSEEMIKYLQSFMPFIMGIDETMFKLAEEYLDEENTIYIVNIKKNQIDVSKNRNLKGKKRKSIM